MFVSSSSMSVSLMIGLEHAYSFLVSTVILEDLLQKLSNTLVPLSTSLTTQFNVCVLFFNICVYLMTCLQLQSIGLLRISCERIHGVEMNAAIFCFFVLQLELWRFRLPASTVPEDTVVRYENEVLQVTIPKNPVTCAEWIFNKKDNDAADGIYLPFDESKADTRQQCFLDECTENPITVLRAMNGFDSSSDIEDKSTRTGHNTEQELQFQQRALSNDLESFGSPQHARKRSSCTKAARQQGGGGESPHFLHDLGSWVHNFAIFV